MKEILWEEKEPILNGMHVKTKMSYSFSPNTWKSSTMWISLGVFIVESKEFMDLGKNETSSKICTVKSIKEMNMQAAVEIHIWWRRN